MKYPVPRANTSCSRSAFPDGDSSSVSGIGFDSDSDSDPEEDGDRTSFAKTLRWPSRRNYSNPGNDEVMGRPPGSSCEFVSIRASSHLNLELKKSGKAMSPGGTESTRPRGVPSVSWPTMADRTATDSIPPSEPQNRETNPVHVPAGITAIRETMECLSLNTEN